MTHRGDEAPSPNSARARRVRAALVAAAILAVGSRPHPGSGRSTTSQPRAARAGTGSMASRSPSTGRRPRRGSRGETRARRPASGSRHRVDWLYCGLGRRRWRATGPRARRPTGATSTTLGHERLGRRPTAQRTSPTAERGVDGLATAALAGQAPVGRNRRRGAVTFPLEGGGWSDWPRPCGTRRCWGVAVRAGRVAAASSPYRQRSRSTRSVIPRGQPRLRSRPTAATVYGGWFVAQDTGRSDRAAATSTSTVCRRRDGLRRPLP